MPQQQSIQLTHRNHYLFADYYLDNRIRSRRDWPADADARATYRHLQQLWADFRPHAAGSNEAQTEQRWIQPVLDALGHVFEVQVSLSTPHGTKQPDYVLFPDAAARAALPAGPVGEADLGSALAVADAKRWDRKLDSAADGETLPAGKGLSNNPGYQIDFYIRHSGRS